MAEIKMSAAEAFRGESVPLTFPSFRSCLHALAHSPFHHRQSSHLKLLPPSLHLLSGSHLPASLLQGAL